MFIFLTCLLAEKFNIMPVGMPESHIIGNIRLVKMPAETQPLKNCAQMFDIVAQLREFLPRYVRGDVMSDIFTYHIFQLRDRENLISSLFLKHQIFYDRNKLKRDAIVLHTIFTPTKYRRNGYAKKLICKAVKSYVNTAKLTNPIITIYLDPEWDMFVPSFVLCHMLGFDKYSVCKNMSSGFVVKVSENEDFDNLQDMVNELISNKEGGCIFALFVDYNKFTAVKNVNMKYLIDKGNLIKEMLLERK